MTNKCPGLQGHSCPQGVGMEFLCVGVEGKRNPVQMKGKINIYGDD